MENKDYGQAKPYPEHWGKGPIIVTRDIVELPDGYGFGSSTIRQWILEQIAKDNE